MEWICGLPFYTPSYKMEDFMLIRDLIEQLIYLKSKYEIYYPDSECVNLACNVLEKMPQDITVYDLLDKIKENNNLDEK